MQYTIKDILSYNNPCLQCGTGTILKLWVQHQTSSISEIITYSMVKNSKTSIEFSLIYMYDYSLKLIINCDTNEYAIYVDYDRNKIYTIGNGAEHDFNDFILNNNLRLRLTCSKCTGWSEFSNLNFKDKLIGPVSLKRECLYLRSEDGTQFYLSTHIDEDTTSIYYKKAESEIRLFSNYDDMWWPTNCDNHAELPAISKFSFKNKGEMLEALQTYVMLS